VGRGADYRRTIVEVGNSIVTAHSAAIDAVGGRFWHPADLATLDHVA
jgi:hypothetical protein